MKIPNNRPISAPNKKRKNKQKIDHRTCEKTRASGLGAGLVLALILGLFLCFFLAAPVWAEGEEVGAYQDIDGEAGPGPGEGQEVSVRARVLEKLEVKEESVNNYQMVTETLLLEIISGDHEGQTLITDNVMDPMLAYNIRVEEGDQVVLFLITDAEGEIVEGHITEKARDRLLLVMAFLFMGLLILIGGLRGLRALLALAITLVAILKVLLPAILKGYSPILMSILISAGVVLLSIPLITGWNKKSVSAILGTMGGVLVAGLLAYSVSLWAGLTGLSMEEANMLAYIPQGIEFNFVGLLFATNILGALGAVMDVAVSISSSVWEIKEVNPGLSAFELLQSGMNIGRDIVGTMANTLILAYSGGSMYMLLLFMAYDMPLFEIINIDAVSTEVVRSLAGSIGLVLTVPLTALVASLLFAPGTKGQDKKEKQKKGASLC